jgi:hypothetical protein
MMLPTLWTVGEKLDRMVDNVPISIVQVSLAVKVGVLPARGTTGKPHHVPITVTVSSRN